MLFPGKKLLVICALFLFSVSSTYAAQVSSLLVEVSPSTIGINQAVDVTVKAIDSNGAIVKDYAGNVWMELIGLKDVLDASFPSDGIYEFVAQDQGVKTFSKGLVVKAPGEYTVQVSEIENESIKGQAPITITAGNTQTTEKKEITISSPLPNGTETNSTISVVGNANIQNAKVTILLNGEKAKDAQANARGDFNAFITDMKPGKWTIKTIVTDVQGTIVAESADIPFSYTPANLGEIKAFEVTPSTTLKQGQKATFTVHLGEEATQAELALKNTSGKVLSLPLDKTKAGVFTKQLLMDAAETYTITATWRMGTEEKTQENIGTLAVLEGKGIREVSYTVDPLDKTKIALSWKTIGDVPYVLVQYGLAQDALSSGSVFAGATGSIEGIDVAAQSYYMRLFPATEQGEIIGEPSDIILVEQALGSAPVCRVEGIVVETTKIGDQYFLTWKAAENAERYIVYRSDRPVRSIADMQKIGETSDLKFPYPFDPQAKTEGYAYYAVVAMCQDGNALQIGDTKKVQVGPETNLLLVLLISLLLFGIYIMKKNQRSVS